MHVAVFAQIDPAAIGGIQSNAVSLISAIDHAELPIDTTVIALDGFGEGLRRRAPRVRVMEWPYNQEPIRPPKGWSSGQSLPRPINSGIRDALRALCRGKMPARSLDRELRAQDVDVIHFPYQQYFQTSLPSIYEPWDLQHRHLPDFFAGQDAAWRDQLYRRGCERAAFVVTATKWTKEDICSSYGIARKKIAVIERGSSLFEELLDGTRPGVQPPNLSTDRGFFLYPAAMYPHKNHLRLLRAVAQLRNQGALSARLVCTGRTSGPVWMDVQALVRELDLAEHVSFLGPVSDDELAWLMQRADLMVFPSLFEGLGLPILEGLAAGLPVAAGRVTCVPDLVGNAAILFDPTDVDGIAAAILQAITHRERFREAALAFRPDLQRFRWRSALPRFVSVYKAAAGKPLSADERDLLESITR